MTRYKIWLEVQPVFIELDDNPDTISLKHNLIRDIEKSITESVVLAPYQFLKTRRVE